MSPANVLDERPDLVAQVEAWRLHVLLKAGYPARFWHPGAPWVRSGAYRNFRTTTFYLLRRRV